VIAYTGETHAMIYPCNCPIEPDGGIARRATFVKKLRAQNPQMLLLDSGGVFGGGLMDEYNQSSELDQRRTDIAVRAMALMKYDAVAVGDDEFNFGREYFSGLMAKYKIPFVSSNCPVPGVAPFVIKRAGKVSVGIVGVSPQSAGPKAGGITIPDAARGRCGGYRTDEGPGRGPYRVVEPSGETEDRALLRQVKE
jgi:2',3'-cyclic-nucleotide 2'-phosphodiesterase (5'-nucleotidase family)